ncbi:MAG: DoxX family membrane protein [Candidatus Kerfeldbacteria bacterium]|nr:DoxX family membrane protein [Candidatus Kerfeldbacteria bacterium]
MIIRIVVGGIFLLFGIIKVIEPHEIFFRSIRDYQMLPVSIVPAFGSTMMYIEIALGVLLILGLFTRLAAWGITGLLLMFITALSQAIARGLVLTDCGCSGSIIRLGETPSSVILRDVILLVAMSWFLLNMKPAMKYTIDALFARSSTTQE